jgi:excisionase family DNA binding protein
MIYSSDNIGEIFPVSWLNIGQAATYLGYSTHHLRRLARSGVVKSVRPTGRFRFRREWLDEFMLGGPAVAPVRRPRDPAVRVVNGRVRYRV